jgi:lipopolysaccharide biosynthesis regulator YciM
MSWSNIERHEPKPDKQNQTKNEKTNKMSSYSSKRKERSKDNDSCADNSLKRSVDMDRLSLVGSVRSDMSTSALEKRLADAQQRIKQLENVTDRQQAMIARLMEVLSERKP